MDRGEARPGRPLLTVTASGSGAQTTLRGGPSMRLRLSLGGALLSLLIGAGLAPVLTARRSGESPVARGAVIAARGLASLPQAAAAPLSGAIGAVGPVYRIGRAGGAISAQNPAQHLRVRFYRSHVLVRSGALSLGLGLRAIGYGRSLRAVLPARPRIGANRVTYRHAGLSEWYVNGPLGLEQGFTVDRAEPGGARGPLTLSLGLSADAHAQLAPGGQGLTFGQAGATPLRYGGLRASDATGRPLHSWLELRAGGVRVRVDARGARYPLRIDPLFQQGEVLANAGEEGEGQFGISVALSADGSTALIGAPRDHGEKGAAWVFTRSGGTWAQQGPKLTVGGETGASGAEGSEEKCAEEPGEEPGECAFGASVALSGDGNTALIGDPSATARRGTAWVFTRSGSIWTRGPALAGPIGSGEGHFGKSVALSANGNTALIGDPTAGVEQAGSAWVFSRSGSTWAPQGEVLSSAEAGPFAFFGKSVALSPDGNSALIGGPGDAGRVGAAWMFTRSGSTFSQQGAKLTGAEEGGEGRFGFSVALAADSATALIGGRRDGEGLGAAWVFTSSGSTLVQQGPKLTATGESGVGSFGWSVALSADGNTALIGVPHESHYAGGVRVFTRSGSSWGEEPEQLAGPGVTGSATFGYSVALSGDGTALVGAPRDGHKTGAAIAFAGTSVTPPPPPAVTTVTPREGPAGGGTPVTITGSGFLPGATVTIGTPASAVNVISETEITATTAATTPGGDEVVVSDSRGTSASGPFFTYTAATTGVPSSTPPGSSGGSTGGRTGGSGVLGSQAIVVPPPTLGVSGNLAPVSGKVLVKLPGSSAFVALTSIRQVPFGTIVNAIGGRVSVTTVGPHGTLQTVTFYAGEFKLTQGRGGLVVAALAGGDFSVCPTARERSHLARASSRRASKKHVVRKLWAEGHGSYSTKGSYAAGAVLGTRWLTEDLCGGTLIHVATDRVAVTNLVNHRHVTLKAGHTYFAKAP